MDILITNLNNVMVQLQHFRQGLLQEQYITCSPTDIPSLSWEFAIDIWRSLRQFSDLILVCVNCLRHIGQQHSVQMMSRCILIWMLKKRAAKRLCPSLRQSENNYQNFTKRFGGAFDEPAQIARVNWEIHKLKKIQSLYVCIRFWIIRYSFGVGSFNSDWPKNLLMNWGTPERHSRNIGI